MTKDNKDNGLREEFAGPADPTGRSKTAAIKELAEALGLDVDTLRKGMGETILQPGEARTISQRTPPIVFDEIEHGLDPEARKAFLRALEEGQLRTGNRTAFTGPTMFFTGNDAGKTENLNRLAELLGGKGQIIHLDGREFQEQDPTAINRLLGHPPGYEASEIPAIGPSTDAVKIEIENRGGTAREIPILIKPAKQKRPGPQ